eukprot:Hpha_TRINITY_DN9243_c0_g1::TRINITY_DN9243_c0_g1_i2::g.28800::m.28800
MSRAVLLWGVVAAVWPAAAAEEGRCAKVIAAGTGNAMPNPLLASSCTVVTVGRIADGCRGYALVFDAGFATSTRLSHALGPKYGIDALFVSHRHADHYADAGSVAFWNWVNGNDGQPPRGYTNLPVYAPTGDGLPEVLYTSLEAMRPDMNHRAMQPKAYWDLRAFEPRGWPTILHSNESVGVTVRAVRVFHDNLQAVSYDVVIRDVGRVIISADIDDSANSTANFNLFASTPDLPPVDLMVHEIVSEGRVGEL